MDLNTKKIKKNAFRVTKVRGQTASRIRVPGGYLPAEHLAAIQEIAEQYGNGSVHLTTRQGFEIPGIDMKNIDAVNKLLQPIIEGLKINQHDPGKGYTSAGTRNIAACIGNNVCPYANYNSTGFAKRIENAVFPHDFHFKIALTGCPNDCIKARMNDFGIIGMTEPQYDAGRCVGCGGCEKACRLKSVDALELDHYKIKRDHVKCVGCGECVLACPTRAFTRSREKYYRLVIMGRTGKKNPRLAEDFIAWADEDSIIKIIKNTYAFVKEHINLGAPGGKEHIGYIIDRTGFEEYKKFALEGVVLSPKAVMNQNVYWSGVHYKLPSYK
ncbi:MAG: sulfite reductase subunit C [Oscillospiraceae bacterium]|nr:sulfite reductase subunit C [Oscillospiraceae bacterium]